VMVDATPVQGARLVGYLAGGRFWVEEAYRGQGLSAALVLAGLLARGGDLTQGGERDIRYTKAGRAACETALHTLVAATLGPFPAP